MDQEDPEQTPDVLVVGAGPAGVTAAALCADKGLSVALIDDREHPRPPAPLVWVDAAIRTPIEGCGADADALLGRPVGSLTFWSADSEQTITAALEAPSAHVVDPAALENALIDAAIARGVTWLPGRRVASAEAREEVVQLRMADESELPGRFLIVADGARSTLASSLGVGLESGPISWSARCEVSSGKGKAGRAAPEMVVVLGLIETRGIGCVLRQGSRAVVSVAGPASADDIGEHLEILITDAVDAGVLPKGTAATEPIVSPLLAGGAIEMDTHVGKRSLLVGGAGGFVTSISYEGVYPGMWSAAVASDVVADAANDETGQDVLGEYDARWRVTMGNYLHMPNTDLHFLLPLIFSNQQMADRMATAFLTGQDI